MKSSQMAPSAGPMIQLHAHTLKAVLGNNDKVLSVMLMVIEIQSKLHIKDDFIYFNLFLEQKAK